MIDIISIKKHTWLDLVTLLVQRDLRVRYRGSILGYCWSMLNPLLYMIILSLVFSHIVRIKMDAFAIFILSGIMGWNLFQQSVGIGINSIVANGHLLRKVPIPAFLFPASSVLGVLVNFVLSFIPFIVVSAVLSKVPGWSLIALPAIIVPYLCFIFGIVLALSSINVRFRDVGHSMEPILQILFYATPIVYPLSSIPEKYHVFFNLNPLTHFVGALRTVLFDNKIPSVQVIALLYAVATIALLVGLLIHRKLRDQFIYNL
ncbi:ABC transporter permease [Oligoflexus tunisiensis]|uniref:ABC transporter permease n=1 Tax=Oligoflexus tunisiensis TaxID=708132 RepID=UPI00114C9A0F|nr:ABC transporter permease [Oligoflexus tunisiensis]